MNMWSYHAVYNRGKERGRQTAHRLKERGKELTMNTALLAEIDSRNEAFTTDFISSINSSSNADALWEEYEMGVREGIKGVLGG